MTALLLPLPKTSPRSGPETDAAVLCDALIERDGELDRERGWVRVLEATDDPGWLGELAMRALVALAPVLLDDGLTRHLWWARRRPHVGDRYARSVQDDLARWRRRQAQQAAMRVLRVTHPGLVPGTLADVIDPDGRALREVARLCPEARWVLRPAGERGLALRDLRSGRVRGRVRQ